ncbi:MAG: CHRD domain-containing protein, partial [Verrucomicrobia bacterium]|nr:CHRD domain-containing protein [Verrucomicrobiota bacterium]
DTNELQYAVAYSEMSGRATMMHFHLGEAGVNGPVIQTVFGEPYTTQEPLGTSAAPPLYGKQAPKGRSAFFTGTYKLQGNKALNPPLTVEQEKADLLNGKIYLNIHTYLNEAGEIRGQVLLP